MQPSVLHSGVLQVNLYGLVELVFLSEVLGDILVNLDVAAILNEPLKKCEVGGFLLVTLLLLQLLLDLLELAEHLDVVARV